MRSAAVYTRKIDYGQGANYRIRRFERPGDFEKAVAQSGDDGDIA